MPRSLTPCAIYRVFGYEDVRLEAALPGWGKLRIWKVGTFTPLGDLCLTSFHPDLRRILGELKKARLLPATPGKKLFIEYGDSPGRDKFLTDITHSIRSQAVPVRGYFPYFLEVFVKEKSVPKKRSEKRPVAGLIILQGRS